MTFRHKALERIYYLTRTGEIKWEYTHTITKHCKRLRGVGMNHMFVIVEYDKKKINYKVENYVGCISKYITDIENTWEFVNDRFSEIDKFIKTIKEIIENREESEAV
jgi:hypothetical protein